VKLVTPETHVVLVMVVNTSFMMSIKVVLQFDVIRTSIT
jgi:hypothetical protein